MPIYEYTSAGKGCSYCQQRFEAVQRMNENPLLKCPRCQQPVIRVPSRFRACILETPDEVTATESTIQNYEKEGMWSHAAELADKSGLDERAREDYKKAGYDM
jgi:putative FmdB family regulatory protein